MPVYTYRCDDCGEFDSLQPMSRAGEPRPCDTCGRPSPSVVRAPRLALMREEQHRAHATNERSRHEPRVGGCGHDQGRSRRAAAGDASRHTRTAPRGTRPWMLGH